MKDIWNILIVDDSPDDRAEIRRLLLKGSDRRYRFHEAESGEAGLRQYQEMMNDPPDCMLLDYFLPDRNAVEVLEEFCQGDDLPPCPVVVLTGADNRFGPAALRVGAQDYVGKNWTTPESLTRSVENAIERWQLLKERKRAETALQKSEERLRVASQIAGMGVITIDYSRNTATADAIAARQFGLPEGEAVSRNEVHARFPEEDRAEIFSRIAQCLDPAGDGFFLREHRVVRPDGSVRWLSVRKQVTFEESDGGRRPASATLVAVDITDRKEAEQALHQSEERLRLAAQTADFGIHDYDAPAAWSFWTPELYGLVGIESGTEIKMETIRNLIHPEDRTRVYQAMEAALDPNGAGFFAEEFRIQRPDSGETRWLYNRSQTTFVGVGEARRPLRNTGIIQDITDRKTAELALWESRERMQLAAEAGGIGTWEWDIAAGRLRWSEQMERNAGFAPGAFGGTIDDFRALIHPDDRERVNEAIRKAFDDKAAYAIEFRMMRPDGGVRWTATRATVVRDAENKPVRMVGVDVDVTEQRVQQSAIEELNVRLRRAMAESHHRIKNNLQVLSVIVDLQRMDAPENVSVAGLDRLSAHINTLASLHDLLTLEMRQEGENTEMISLKSALAKMLPFMETIGGGRRILLQTEEMSLPLKEGANFLILVNELVSNAIKHGRGEIEIHLRWQALAFTEAEPLSARMARLEVCDDGPGFPPEFDAERAANTGLRLIESIGQWDLDGVIQFENRPQGGARVTVVFPVLPGAK